MSDYLAIKDKPSGGIQVKLHPADLPLETGYVRAPDGFKLGMVSDDNWQTCRWPNGAEKAKENQSKLIYDVISQRKEQEAIGVTINGARYSGEASNRQAIAEAIDYINATGATTFASWKDSDGNYHTDHAAQDVIDAYMAIGVKRSALIAKEAQFVADIKAGTLTDVSVLDWTV